MEVSLQAVLVDGNCRVSTYSCHSELPLVHGQKPIFFSLEGRLEFGGKLLSIDLQFFQSNCLTGLEFADDGAFITDVVHVLPPLFRVELEEELLSDLLVQKLSSIGCFVMEVVVCTVGFVLVAVSAGTSVTAQSRVDQFQVDVVLDLGVELSEALDEAVGLPVIWVGADLLV